MRKIEDKTTYFFVDEAGDPTFFNRRGEFIVGREGCSKILVLGFIKTEKPKIIRQKIRLLREEILADPYLNRVVSVKNRTAAAFHATDDIPEVREKVYKLIKELPIKSEFVVARKLEKIFAKKHRSSENIFYDDLIIKLFQNQLHKSRENVIYFAVRGNRARQMPLEEAIKTAVNTFESKWKTRVDSEIKIFPQRPSDEPCLQVVDYLNWAVQRVFLKKETRYLDFIKDKISLIVDLYDFKQYKTGKNYYNRNNPFDINKISPL